MSTTFGELKTEVSAALRDPDGKTFDTTAVGRLINEGLAEVGRILPVQFQEDIDPVADTLQYTLRNAVFGEANPDIEVSRVELWDTTTTPNTRFRVIPPASAGRANDSQAGWSNWGGVLFIPTTYFNAISGSEDSYLYRVWGYSPYPAASDDADVIAVSNDGYWAIVAHAQVAALNRLVNDRTLFTQWQTRAGISDISPAGLMNELNFARDEWRRKSKALLRLRSAV